MILKFQKKRKQKLTYDCNLLYLLSRNKVVEMQNEESYVKLYEGRRIYIMTFLGRYKENKTATIEMISNI